MFQVNKAKALISLDYGLSQMRFTMITDDTLAAIDKQNGGASRDNARQMKYYNVADGSLFVFNRGTLSRNLFATHPKVLIRDKVCEVPA